MRDSYLNLDEEMRYVKSVLNAVFLLRIRPRFLNCQDGGKRPGRSLLDVGVEEAIRDAGFDNQAFLDRGGIFGWSRTKDATLDW